MSKIPDQLAKDLALADAPSLIASSHLYPLFHKKDFRDIVTAVCGRLEIETARNKLEYDTLAFCGASGMLVAPMVSMILDKNMLMVRKRFEYGHGYSTYRVEGVMKGRYVIIDDMIATSETINHMLSSINQHTAGKQQCAGVLLYSRYNVDGLMQTFTQNGVDVQLPMFGSNGNKSLKA